MVSRNINICNALIAKNLKGTYRNSFLKNIWYLLTPLIMGLSYYVALMNVLHYSLDNYWIYLTSGLFSAVFFVQCLIGGSFCLMNEEGTISKMKFPKYLIPLAYALSRGVVFVISLILIIVVYLFAGCSFNPLNLLCLIPLVLLQIIFMIGVTAIASFVNIFVKDFGNFLQSAATFIVWIMPTSYLSKDATGLLKTIITINPMTYFQDSYHNILYFNCLPDCVDLLICVMCTVITLFVSMIIYKIYDWKIPEVI